MASFPNINPGLIEEEYFSRKGNLDNIIERLLEIENEYTIQSSMIEGINYGADQSGLKSEPCYITKNYIPCNFQSIFTKPIEK
ncbi:hypothetical protein ENUP19_0054G0017 [Entamoeba nuttalli]|uniref:CUE domain-containing protein n=1 Tax=Entamoeba nuttalli TaxID=412467 RepID=A0ABQ0DC67_9EUKA